MITEQQCREAKAIVVIYGIPVALPQSLIKQLK